LLSTTIFFRAAGKILADKSRGTAKRSDHPVSLHPALQSLYFVLVGGVIYTLRLHWAYDDPFITYRYAHNLIQGLGFVYNPGERILSTTTPLLTLILAAICPVWSDLPHAAILVGSLSLAWGGLSIWKLGNLWGMPSIGWIGMWVYPTFPLLLSTLGSEMPLYVALCLAALGAFTAQKYTPSAAFAALAVLTRPDGILLGLLLAVGLIRLQRRIPAATGLVFLSLSLPWFIFAWQYFGSPLPVTLSVKQHQASMGLSQHFAPGLLTIAGWYLQTWHFKTEIILALIGVFAGLFWFRGWLLLAGWTVLYFLGYAILRVDRNFWYYAPLVPAFLIAVGIGIAWIQHSLSYPRFSYLLTGLLCASLAFGQFTTLWRDRYQSDPRYSIYRVAGEWLQENTPEDARVGTLEIGILGYYSKRTIIDFAGLLQPLTARQLRPGSTYQEAASWAIENYQPEYLVLHRSILPEVERKYTSLAGMQDPPCTLIQRLEGSNYAYTGELDIYQCNYSQ
jgi:hypothetical protein